MLHFLSEQSSVTLWMIFLAENVVITIIAIAAGSYVIKRHQKHKPVASKREIVFCIVTNLLNTAITYAGFRLWQHGYIEFSFDINWCTLTDFLLLFMAMDLAMYLFHYGIHRTIAYRYIHQLHHAYTNPTPIDLFVLHPLETLGFGALWLAMLYVYSFNFAAALIYLTVNVVYGITGHLGIEPFPARWRNKPLLKYLGTSTFHHRHHSDIHCNFGFYTNIWDKLFKTYKP